MVDFPASLQVPLAVTPTPGAAANAYTQPPQSSMTLTVDDPAILDPNGHVLAPIWTRVDNKSDFPSQGFVADRSNEPNSGQEWFENFHVIPRELLLGNLLGETVVDVEVYSAFRDDVHSWDDWIPPTSGITLEDAPALPTPVQPQDGYQVKVRISSDAPPLVQDEIDYVFDIYTTPQPIEFQLVQLISVPPEMPYLERLQFNTDVLGHVDGTEQRISVRKNPRQLFEWSFVMDDGDERNIMDNLLFDWQSRTFGIPIWQEMTFTTQEIIAGETTIQVGTTDDADYRTDPAVGNLALVYGNQLKTDVVAVTSLTSTTLTFSNSVLNNYPVGTRVMPLRVGVITGRPTGSRYPVGANTLKLNLRVTDNDSNLADSSSWPMFEGKVLLDDPNVIAGTMSESFDQNVTVFDNGTGRTFQSATWRSNKRTTRKTFFANGRSAVWTVRQLIYALRGQQISFWLPTFVSDLRATQDLVSAQDTLVVSKVGYTEFVQTRQPRDVIRVEFNDGTSPVVVRVLSSSVINTTEEELVLDIPWASDKAVSTIARISYVEKVRFANDIARFEHNVGDLIVKITAPVVTVFD